MAWNTFIWKLLRLHKKKLDQFCLSIFLFIAVHKNLDISFLSSLFSAIHDSIKFLSDISFGWITHWFYMTYVCILSMLISCHYFAFLFLLASIGKFDRHHFYTSVVQSRNFPWLWLLFECMHLSFFSHFCFNSNFFCQLTKFAGRIV